MTDRLAVVLVRPSALQKKRSVLVVKLDAIGDFILWLDAAKDLRTVFPPQHFELTLIGNSVWTSLAEKLPYFDRVSSVDRRKFLTRPLYRWSILRQVRRNGFDTALQTNFSREFSFGDAVVLASGARARIGSAGDCSNLKPWLKTISDRWYTNLIPTSPQSLMELERNAEFMRGLGLKQFEASVPVIAIHSSFPAGFDLAPSYYVLFPGAGVPFRRWPLAYFSDIAQRIYASTGWRGIICGAPDEDNLAEELFSMTKAPLQNWCGRTTLSEMISVIANASIVISNETSAVHIAAAVSTPSVCIMGGGHYGRFLPYHTKTTQGAAPILVIEHMDCYNCNWFCKFTDRFDQVRPCIENIGVDAVWSAIRRVIEKKKEA